MPVYIQHETLAQIGDVFDAESIWRAPGLALFGRRPLLRDLLERCPREQRGRAATRCFSHVTLMLPQDDLDDDRQLARGARARELAQSLAALHQKDFGDLLGGEDVRYDVIGADALAPGQIGVRFGHAMYLPAAGESPLYQVSVSRDAVLWTETCTIYPGQRLALVAADTCGIWPFAPDARLLLINDGPAAPIELQLRPREGYECVSDKGAGHYLIRMAGGGGGTRLFVRVKRRAEAPASVKPGRPVSVWHPRHSMPDPDATAVPSRERMVQGDADATYAPLADQRVSLVALALPRLSRYRDSGAESLAIGLDQALTVNAHQPSLLGLYLDASDQLQAGIGAAREPVLPPASFAPIDGHCLRLLAPAPAMAERYCALLTLDQALSATMPRATRAVFGRGTPLLAALRVLDRPGFLSGANGAAMASADRVGLSRQACSMEAVATGIRISKIAPTQALYHLDPALQYVATLGDGGAEQPYLLPFGHHLVAGNYVLRFDA